MHALDYTQYTYKMYRTLYNSDIKHTQLKQ